MRREALVAALLLAACGSSPASSPPGVTTRAEFEAVLCAALNHLSAAMVPLNEVKAAVPSEVPGLMREASTELDEALTMMDRGRNWGDGGSPEARALWADTLTRINGAFWGTDVPDYHSGSTVGKIVEATALHGQRVTEQYGEGLPDAPDRRQEAREAIDVTVLVGVTVVPHIASGFAGDISIPFGEEVGYQVPCPEDI